MKGLLLSSARALGAFAMAPANAAPIATHGVIVAPAATTDVDCRQVTKTVYSHGVRRSVTSRECGGGGYGVRRGYVERRSYGDRGYHHHHDRPGIHLGIGVR